MKNISQYFDDSVKPGNSTSSNDEAKEGYSYNKKGSIRKRNRVKIKISRSSTSERICDILENSNDMIDKTPSPFSKENGKNENQHDTPKRSSTSKLILATRRKTLTDNDQNVYHKEMNNCNSSSSSNSNNKKKQKKVSEDISQVCSDTDRKLKKEQSNKVNVRKINNHKIMDQKELINMGSNDDEENDKDESNAFAILMGNNKIVSPCAAVTKLSPPDTEASAKKSDEYKGKLKRTKEKLQALADKRGYSKRKIAEIEESEKVEEMIKNRLKLFKGEKQNDSSTSSAANLSPKPLAGTLLNYFSKAQIDLNTAGMTTVVVKADVHATQSNDPCQQTRSIKTKQIRRSTRNKNPDLDLSQADDIKILESINVEVQGNKGKHNKQQMSKRKWSLRVNLQSSENEDTSLGNSSDEEIFTPRIRLTRENHKKSETLKSLDPQTSLILKDKTKGIISKQTNSAMRSRKKKNEGAENKQELVKLDKYQSRSTDFIDIITENEDMQNLDDLGRKTAKLAPLFAKRKKPDPEAIAARRLFLQPDTTDTRIKNMKQKTTTIYSALPFPLISHITQLSNCSVFNESKILDILKVPTEHVVPVINLSHFVDLIDYSKKKLESVEKLSKPKIPDVLAEIGKNCLNVKEMWDVISVIKGRSNETVKSLKSSTSKKKRQSEMKKVAQIDEKQLEYCSWTYKYRPKHSTQVIGNEEAVGKLKDWLVGWSAVPKANEDSGDEFYQSDNSRSMNIENNQVAVLLGPHGCGKTASVYAIAEEFGYMVLELNASSRRTGKKLSKELEEATKSHRIKNDNNKTTVVANTICYDVDLDEIESKKVPRNSLILLEDVDLIFEEDEGFISATYQLALNSKRPIVMTCRDVCPHLNKMAPQQNKIYFQRPSDIMVSALLELISLAETGYRLPKDCKIDLLRTGDLRRSLLQLQYLLLSGPPKSFERSINLKNLFWHSVLCNVYKPVIKVSRKSKKRKMVNNAKINDRNILVDLASKLDDIALMSSLTDVQDTALDLSEIKIQPSLSLTEDMSFYSFCSDLSLEISEWIGNNVMGTRQFNDSEIQLHNNIVLKKQINKNVDLVLSRATSVLDRQILATDYLPSLRTICRAEKSRADTNNKRGNRFFHYLHNLKAAVTAPSIFKSNILTAACNMMHDPVDDSETSRNDPITT